METWIIIEAVATSLSALIAAIAIYQTVRLQKKQMLLEQRQFLLPLWTQLQGLNEIDPQKPVWMDVIKAVNILELIAVSWEGQLIDENIIRRMYSHLYIRDVSITLWIVKILPTIFQKMDDKCYMLLRRQ